MAGGGREIFSPEGKVKSLDLSNRENVINNFSQIRGNNDNVVNNGAVPGISTLPNSGSGGFATKDFKVNDIVEIIGILKIPKNAVDDNILRDYVFMYDSNNYALPLGYGAVYNHLDDPNLTYSFTDDRERMIFKATKDIKAGEELFVSYGMGYWRWRGITPKNLTDI